MKSAKDKVLEIIETLSDIENRKFAIWCARRANRENVPAVAKYLDAAEGHYISGTVTKEELAASRAEYCAGWEASANSEKWLQECTAYKTSDWGAFKFPKHAAWNAAYWAATHNVVSWEAQIEYLKEMVG